MERPDDGKSRDPDQFQRGIAMEKMLLKIARQLDSLDEASLMALWSKYATLTSRFEPTKRWEENCLIFSLIQAKHWKNQLFNYSWSQQKKPPLKNTPDAPDIGNVFSLEKPVPVKTENMEKTSCRVISFKQESDSTNTGANSPDSGKE